MEDAMEMILSFAASLTMNTIVPVLILLAVGVAVINAIVRLMDAALGKSRLEKVAVSLIKSLVKVLLYLLLGMMVASRLGIDVSGVLALTSVVTLAVSLALQDALANVIGGFTLLSTHPFKAGDYVEIAGQGGVVESIGLTYTQLSSPDKKIISLPNASVVSSQIVNYSTSETRRIDFAVSTAYSAQMEDVKAALLRAAQVPYVMEDPAPFVGLTNYGEYSISYVLRVWVPNANYWDVTFAINERIKAEFDAAGVAMTYPHLNVHIDK